MKRTNVAILAVAAGLMLMTGCASKKDLENCRFENKELMGNYQSTKDKLQKQTRSLLRHRLAYSRSKISSNVRTRITQLCSSHLTRALQTQAQTISISPSWWTRLTSLTSIYAILWR